MLNGNGSIHEDVGALCFWAVGEIASMNCLFAENIETLKKTMMTMKKTNDTSLFSVVRSQAGRIGQSVKESKSCSLCLNGE